MKSISYGSCAAPSKVLLAFLLMVLGGGFAKAADSPDQERARLVVHLLDYLAKDYGGAVVNGAVVSQGEYAEQVEFVSEVVKTSEGLPELRQEGALLIELQNLREMILAKAPADAVAAKAKVLQATVVKAARLEVAPSRWPKMSSVQDVFVAQCSSCHGATGVGDGLAGMNLEPKPANFHDQERMAAASPLGLYNTIRIGVPGTGMPAFTALTDDQAWALAFYLQGLRYRRPLSGETVTHDGAKAEAALRTAAITLKEVASSIDSQLVARLTGASLAADELLPQIRLYEGAIDSPVALASISSSGPAKDGDRAAELLREAESSYLKGDVAAAKTLALRAYLEGFEPIEPKLRASSPALVQEVETVMAEVRRSINQNLDAATVKGAIAEATRVLAKCSEVSEAGVGMSPTLAFSATSAIILREGFEAVLIVIALLSVIRAAGTPVAALYVHAGWVGALALGFGMWFLSGWLMALSGAGREALEGFTSLLAVVILLVVGFWLHNQTEIGRWKRFLNGKVREALQGGRVWTLASISFIAVFREAIETVLFIRAIWLDSGSAAKWAVLSGLVVSLSAVFMASWLVLRFSVRVPVKALFSASSFIMAILVLVLTGKGLHALQETGLVSETGASGIPRVDLLGIFPTWETALSQLVMLGIVLVLWFFGRRPSGHGKMASA